MSKQYVEPQKRYEDERSSGILFLALGGIGILAVILCFAGIFKLPLNDFQLLILLAMFLFFIGAGIWSLRNASMLAKNISTEENQLEEMWKWIAENSDSFCRENTEELIGTELYFQREQEIRQAISEKFPETDEGLMDLLVEETYHSLFES